MVAIEGGHLVKIHSIGNFAHYFFTSFSLQFFFTIFLVKSKLSTAKKSKTTTFSRVFSPRKSTIFFGKSLLEKIYVDSFSKWSWTTLFHIMFQWEASFLPTRAFFQWNFGYSSYEVPVGWSNWYVWTPSDARRHRRHVRKYQRIIISKSSFLKSVLIWLLNSVF